MSANRTNMFIKIAISVLVVVCIITILRLQIQFNALNDEKKELEQQVMEVYDEIEEKQAEIDRPYDDEYVVRIAREKLGYHLPDEIIYYNDLN